MAEARCIDVDLVALRREDETLRTVLAWGDPVTVLDQDARRLKVETVDHVERPDGSIVAQRGVGFLARRAGRRETTAPAASSKVLKVDFVDVQQGDGALVETPAGRVLTLDGGDNQLFARYLAARYPGTTEQAPLPIDAMVVSHGDADHFAGLAEIQRSETHAQPRKRLFAWPARVFHNGLVKRPSSVPDAQQLGASRKVGRERIATGLEEDLLALPDRELNAPFKAWKRALKAWHDRAPIAFRRLSQGDHDAFDFLRDEGIDVQVLGPVPVRRGRTEGLLWLEDPSHTINGHSIVLRLSFGRWRLLFAGDLNTPAEETLTAEHRAGRADLRSEVFKVPHHGSAEFSPEFLEAVRPLVSVVSSGDESARKEYMHPRATLMSALGRHARAPRRWCS